MMNFDMGLGFTPSGDRRMRVQSADTGGAAFLSFLSSGNGEWVAGIKSDQNFVLNYEGTSDAVRVFPNGEIWTKLYGKLSSKFVSASDNHYLRVRANDWARVTENGAILASGPGVTSVVKNGTGDYTVHFSTSSGGTNRAAFNISVENGYWLQPYSLGDTEIRLRTYSHSGVPSDRLFNIARFY